MDNNFDLIFPLFHLTHRHVRYLLNLVILLCFICILIAGTILFASCDPVANVIVENRMPTDIVIIHESIDQQDKIVLHEELGRVSAQQTEQLRYAIWPTNNTVLLKAEDPSGKVIWQKSWPGYEFFDLEDVGWKRKIVVSPETGS